MEPLTLIAGAALVAWVVARGSAPALPSLPAAPPDPCAAFDFERAALEGAVQGSATGLAGGPKGAAAGAVSGSLLPLMSQCGRDRIAEELNKAKKAVCAKADKVLRQVNARPPGWSSWSCDQRLAYVAVLVSSPAGALVGAAILAGNASASAAKAIKAEADRLRDTATKAAEDFGQAAEDLAEGAGDAVKSGAKKLGIRL